MSWESVAIEEIAQVKGGKRLPKGHDFVTYPTPHPYIRARDIGEGKIEIKDHVYLSEDTYNYLKSYIVNEGDVVITIVGANIGDVGYVQENLDGANLTENAAKLVVNRSKFAPYFLKLCLSSAQSKKQLAFIASGAAQGKLGLYKIKTFLVNKPPIDVQKRIVHLTHNYEILIENNRRRIQLLEESARLLYQEWFVHLRFPGHEQVKITDGVPEGWSQKKLGQMFSIKHGYAFKGEYFSEEETKRILLTPGNFKIRGGIKLDKKKFYRVDGPIPEGYVLNEKDLLITMTDLSKMSDTLGYPLLVPKLDGLEFLHNQRLGLVISNEEYFPKYLYCHVLQDYRYRAFIVGSATGTSVKHTSPKKIAEYLTCLPTADDKLIILFDEYGKNIHHQINLLLAQNQKLAQARDLLLPKLMSGELTV